MALISRKLLQDDNPSTEDVMAEDNALNKRLVERMEGVREAEYFGLLAVRGSNERFMRGWMDLEEHRRHWELPYYETRTDAQWQEMLDEIQAIHNMIKDATLM